MTPRPRHPSEIKTPPTSIGICEGKGSGRRGGWTNSVDDNELRQVYIDRDLTRWTLAGDTTPTPMPPDPPEHFGITETYEDHNTMTLHDIGALSGIVALVLILVHVIATTLT